MTSPVSPAREPAIVIRPLQSQDIERVLAIAIASPEAPHWPEQCYEKMLQPTPQIGYWRAALVISSNSGGSSGGFGSGVMGYAVATILVADRSSELEAIAVHPEARHRGFGGQLLDSLILLASKHGAKLMRLEARASNSAAIALYSARGFEETGLRHGYYQRPLEDALLFERAIGD